MSTDHLTAGHKHERLIRAMMGPPPDSIIDGVRRVAAAIYGNRVAGVTVDRIAFGTPRLVGAERIEPRRQPAREDANKVEATRRVLAEIRPWPKPRKKLLEVVVNKLGYSISEATLKRAIRAG
jgi:hypothetical protein